MLTVPGATPLAIPPLGVIVATLAFDELQTAVVVKSFVVPSL
jgi:hypothetical protein